MRTISLVLLILLLTIEAAAAIECRATLPADRKEHWAWRSIDGRQCWYQGPTGLDKSLLHWPAEPPAPPAPIAEAPVVAPPIATAPEEDEPGPPMQLHDESEGLAASVWPQYEPVFTDRWPDRELPRATYIPPPKAPGLDERKLLRDIIMVALISLAAALAFTVIRAIVREARRTPVSATTNMGRTRGYSDEYHSQ